MTDESKKSKKHKKSKTNRTQPQELLEVVRLIANAILQFHSSQKIPGQEIAHNGLDVWLHLDEDVIPKDFKDWMALQRGTRSTELFLRSITMGLCGLNWVVARALTLCLVLLMFYSRLGRRPLVFNGTPITTIRDTNVDLNPKHLHTSVDDLKAECFLPVRLIHPSKQAVL
jgi:hypothetical protein